MSFDIVTTFKNNIEWCDPFFQSLTNTLFDKSIKIIVYDNSNEKERTKLFKNIEKYKLNIHYHHEEYTEKNDGKHYYVPLWKKAVSLATSDMVCFVHSDVVFFKKNWDLDVNQKLKKHCIFAAGYQNRIKSCFMVVSRDLLINSNFGFKRTYDPSKNYEHSGIMENNEHCACLLNNNKNLSQLTKTFGQFYYFDDDLFFYHQSWSARSHLNSSMPIPEKEKFLHHKRIANTKFCGHFLTKLVNLNSEKDIVESMNKVDVSNLQIVYDANIDTTNWPKEAINQKLSNYYNNIYWKKSTDLIDDNMLTIWLDYADVNIDIDIDSLSKALNLSTEQI